MQFISCSCFYLRNDSLKYNDLTSQIDSSLVFIDSSITMWPRCFKGCIYLVLFFLYNYESDLVRRAERTAFCAADFFPPSSLSGHITKTAKLADCQPNAPEVAQISVIPFSPGSSSLTFKHSDIFSRNSFAVDHAVLCCFRIVRVQVFNEPYADVVFQ